MRSPSKGLILSTQNVFVIVLKKKRFRSFQEFDVTEVMYLIGRFMTNFMSHKVLRASRASFYFKAEEMVLGINGLGIFGGGSTRDFLIHPFIL